MLLRISVFCLIVISCTFSALGQHVFTDTTQVSIPSAPTAALHHNNFNKGVNHSVYGLIDGRITGIGMSTSGNDPNGEFMVRVRGLSTLQMQTKPLLVIDGFVVEDLLAVDPSDIDQITLLRDAGASSIYGVRGGNGVVVISTKRAENKPLSISYSATLGLDQAIQKIKATGAPEYKRYPNASDLGSNHDWVDLISRTGASLVHNVVLSTNTKSLSARASVNFRKADGTLTGTGFDQLNTRINLQQKALNDKLVIQYHIANTLRNADYGFREAIQYAYSSNPTMPIYSTSSEHGGYYQTQFFLNYNPVAIIQQNKNSGKEKSTQIGIRGRYQLDELLKGLSVELSYQRMDEKDFTGSYYAKQSYYIGEFRNGLATIETETEGSDQILTSVNYQKSFKKTDFQFSSAYQFQKLKTYSLYAQGGDFLTDAFSYNNLAESGDFKNGTGIVSSAVDSYEIASWLTTASVVFEKKYFINASASYSGSTRFGVNNKMGLFPSIGGGIQWKEGFGFLDYLKTRVSWGIAGNIPQQSNLSKTLFSPIGYSYQNGNFKPSYGVVRDGNPNLKWEEKTELNLGADFSFFNHRINGSIDWFTNKVVDLISPVTIPSPPNLSYSMVANLGELHNRGLELNLNIHALETRRFMWDLNVNFSNVKTTVNSLSDENYSLTQKGELSIGIFPDGGGCSGHGVIHIQEGAALGQIQGPIFTGIKDGAPVHKDVNGDGVYCDCGDDFVNLGSALPTLIFGFGNNFAFRNFEMSFLLRGAIGHHKINSFRVFQESTEAIPTYNLIKTDYFDPLLERTHLSDRYVENASFIKLDNISVLYHIPSGANLKLTLNASIQNLFTITNYSGNDPEIAYGQSLVKGGPKYIVNSSPLVSGMDARGNYLPSRIFSFGVMLSL